MVHAFYGVRTGFIRRGGVSFFTWLGQLAGVVVSFQERRILDDWGQNVGCADCYDTRCQRSPWRVPLPRPTSQIAFCVRLVALDPKLIELLTKPIDDILLELDAEDRYQAGLALEALAFKLMRILGMDYIATRLRNISATGGAEVDLIFHSSRLVYSRWQVQCKNTARVSLDDVAKEVGLTHFLKSNVIVMVSTGDIGGDARRFANKVMQESNLDLLAL